jgi:uncharacterized protein (TIGR00369 family)
MTEIAPDLSQISPTRRDLGRQSGFRDMMGYRNVVWRDGYAEIELELGPKHMNRLNIVHGGTYMALIDAAMGHATTWCSRPDHVRLCVTIGLTTSFLAAVKSGTIIASGQLEGVHDRVATVTGKIVDANGQLLCAAQGSFRYPRGSEFVEGVPRAR